MFELMAGDFVEFVVNKLKKYNINYGIGGIARIGDGAILAQRILEEYLRIGSNMVILSRSFRQNAKTLSELTELLDLKIEIDKLRQEILRINLMDLRQLRINNNKLKQDIWKLVYSKER